MNWNPGPASAAPVAAPAEVDLMEAFVALLLRWRSLIGAPLLAKALAVGFSLAVPKTCASTDLLADLSLKDGDSIVLPAAPGFVYAVGAVASSSRNARAARSPCSSCVPTAASSTAATWAGSS